jgi:enterochelin esterase-like enzyme
LFILTKFVGLLKIVMNHTCRIPGLLKKFGRIAFWLCFLRITATVYSQPPAVSTGTIIRINEFPSASIGPRTIDVWLPDGYDPLQKYAVLYMHDGQMLFDTTMTWNRQEWGVDETAGRLALQGKIRPCIVVGIWNAGPARHSEYFPQEPFGSLPPSYTDSLLHLARRTEGAVLFKGEVYSDNYLRFIVQELKPYIDSAFSTLRDPANTFIAGSSMGGLISLYAICEYPEIFGGAACLSTHWPGIFTVENNPIPEAFLEYMRHNLPSPENHKIYFDYGTETLDALYEPYQKQADRVMKQNGYKKKKNWQTLKFKGEDHSENAWRGRLEIPLVFLLD